MMKHFINSLCFALALGVSFIQSANAEVVRDTLGFDAQGAVSPSALLSGRVSGVRVSGLDGDINSALSTVVRGGGSLRGDNQPLWIVDGAMLGSSIWNGSDALSQYPESALLSTLNPLAFLNVQDIESIEVLKGQAATAIYGPKGANGVVIIKTRRAAKEGISARWNSTIGYTSALTHNHSFDVSDVKGQSIVDISGFYRSAVGSVAGYGSNYSGVRAAYETKANSVVWFGMSTILSMGNASTPATRSFFGHPSMSLSMRDESAFPGSTEKGWREDYDDDAREYRLVNSAFLTLNFSPSLSLNNTLGVDYRSLSRYVWFGNGTPFGAEKDGAASILSSSQLRYNASSVLSWFRYFGQAKLTLKTGAELSGDMDKFNTMDGVDFFTHQLRAKGLNLHGDKAKIQKYDYDFFTAGAFANASLSFGNIAGLDATYRADWTPHFMDAEPQSYFSFEGHVSPLKGLNLSASYGESGYQRYMPYTYGVTSGYEMFYEGLNLLRAREWNAGADYRTSDGRLSAHLGVFERKVEDSINGYCFGKQGSSYLWYWAGRSLADSWSGSTATAGVEVDLCMDIIRKDNLVWTVRMDGAWNKSIVTDIDSRDRLCSTAGSGLYPALNVKGYPAGSFFGYKEDEQGNLLDQTGDRTITQADKTFLGSPLPQIYGGFGTTLRVGMVCFDAQFDGAALFQIANLAAMSLDQRPASEFSSKYVEDGDFLRLSRVSVSFDVNKSIRLSLSGINLLTLTSYSGPNPDVCAVDLGSFAPARGAVLGMNINF